MSIERGTTYRRWERVVKGFANHWRIAMLELLESDPELTVIDITKKLNINFKTASEHLRRLAIAGLVLKRYDNRNVRHKLTDRAKYILKFLRMLE